MRVPVITNGLFLGRIDSALARRIVEAKAGVQVGRTLYLNDSIELDLTSDDGDWAKLGARALRAAEHSANRWEPAALPTDALAKGRHEARIPQERPSRQITAGRLHVQFGIARRWPPIPSEILRSAKESRVDLTIRPDPKK